MSFPNLSKAIELATKAVEEDKKRNYEEALLCYNHSKIYFLRAMKYEAVSEKAKQSIRIKCSQYCDRAEKIDEFLKKQEKLINKDGNKFKDDRHCEDLARRIMTCHLQDAIVVEKPQVTFSDIVGLDAAKETLKQLVVLPIKYPDLFEGIKIPCKAILLYGLSGADKSYLVKAVATEAKNSAFFSVSSSNLVSKCAEESRTLMRNLFQLARLHNPSIIFFDDVDLLYSSKSDSTAVIKQELFVQMKGTPNDKDSILVFGDTEAPWVLDSALFKIFEKKMYIPLPEESDRFTMFKSRFQNTQSQLSEDDLRLIAKETYRYSSTDIATVVKNVLMLPVKKVQTATHFKRVKGPSIADPSIVIDDLLTPCSPSDPYGIEMTCMNVPVDKLLEPAVTMEDVLQFLTTSKPTVTTEDLKNLETFMKDLGEEM